MHSVYVEERDNISILNIKGRVDASTSGQIHEKIMDELENGCTKMVIDFSDVSYISSAGLRVLIYASKALMKNSGAFSICSLSDSIEKIFEVSRLNSAFPIHKDREASLNALRGQ